MRHYDELGISYYNPQVENWTPQDAVIEAEHLINDQIILFPVTGETYGTGSLAETGFSILSAIRANDQRYVIIYIDPVVDAELAGANAALAKESIRSRALVLAHLKKLNLPNVFQVKSLESMRYMSVMLHDVVNKLELAKSIYAI
jgi:hypothetical protein